MENTKNRNPLQSKKPYPKKVNKEQISGSRAAMALLLTGLTVLFVAVGCYHLYWAIGAFYHDRFGSTLNNVAVIVGSLALNLFVSIKTLVFLETRLLSDNIDADHKKYI